MKKNICGKINLNNIAILTKMKIKRDCLNLKIFFDMNWEYIYEKVIIYYIHF